jgi:hypothetical protein
MNGRHIEWQNHVLLSRSALDTAQHLKSTISDAGAIEVALTKVVEGGVAGYYKNFNETVVPILNNDDGCDGHFISALLENPQDQLLLINWKSVDVSCAPLDQLAILLGKVSCQELTRITLIRLIMKYLRNDQRLRLVLTLCLSTIRYSLCLGIS